MGKKVKNILIIGATGFVGRALTTRLMHSAGCKLFLTASKNNFKCPKAKVFYGDLNDSKFCRHILKDVDIVYYLAGYKKNSLHHSQRPFDFMFGNVNPLLVFLKELANSNIEKIIYLSSIFVDLEIDELIKDGYALGKYINELLLKSFIHQFSFPCVIVRSATIYGPGDNFDPVTANFIPAMIDKTHRARNEVVVWGSGARKIQFIYVEDLVDNLIAVAKNNNDFYIFGNPQPISVRKVSSMVVRFLHKDIKIKYDLTKPDRPTKLFKFKNLIKPKFTIDKGLKRAIDYYVRCSSHHPHL